MSELCTAPQLSDTVVTNAQGVMQAEVDLAGQARVASEKLPAALAAELYSASACVAEALLDLKQVHAWLRPVYCQHVYKHDSCEAWCNACPDSAHTADSCDMHHLALCLLVRRTGCACRNRVWHA